MSTTTPDISTSPAPRNLRLRRGLFGAGFAVVAVAAVAAYLLGGRYVSTDNAYVKANLVNVSADISGKVDAVYVQENQLVRQNDPLFRIDPAPYQLAVTKADAALHEARLRIESLKAELAQKQAALRSTRADLAFRQTDHARVAGLQDIGGMPRAALDAANHELEVAQSKTTETQHELDAVLAELGGNPAIAIDDHPAVRNAQAALAKAKLDLERTVVRAPFTGIASKVPDVGVYVLPALAVLSVVDADRPWVEANLKESQLEHVRVGQRVEIDVDAYSSTKWDGIVDSIGQATGSEFALLPPQNASGNWVKVVQRVPVRIRIVHHSDEPVLRAGMSTEISIDTHSTPTLPATQTVSSLSQ